MWILRRLKPTECHIYHDGQQYFIGTVLDISRKVTAVKGRQILKVRRAVAVAASLKPPRSFSPFQCSLRNNPRDVWPIDALAVGDESPSTSPQFSRAIPEYCYWYCTTDVKWD